MRHYFDRNWDYAGTSMQSWEMILLLCFPIALVLIILFLPIFVFLKWSSREEDLKYEMEHPEILKKNSGWYPWHRNATPYTIAMIAWVIAFLISIA